jgi:hypothetical protein
LFVFYYQYTHLAPGEVISMLEVRTKIGDRDVLAAGSLVTLPDQTSVSIHFSNADLEIVFQDGSEKEPKIAFSPLTQTSARITCSGFSNPLGTSFSIPNAGTIDEKKIGISFFVHALTKDGSSHTPRLINYTVFAG